MPTKKQARRENALSRLKAQLASGVKPLESARLQAGDRVMQELLPQDSKRILKEIITLEDRLSGKRKQQPKKSPTEVATREDDKWLIDIYSVKYGYVKQAERRKNKGKSKKKMKKVKSVSLLKSVKAHPGDILAYREGKRGLSPKDHVFKMRKEEEFNYQTK